MPASQDYRDGAAYGANTLAERLVCLDGWDVTVTPKIIREIAEGIRSTMGGATPPIHVNEHGEYLTP